MPNTTAPLAGNWSRRRVLKTIFCSSAALALNLDRRLLSAGDVAPSDLHWLALGDFGSQAKEQTTVAKAMAAHVKRLAIKPDGLLLLGDNFYGKMSGGVQSARWQIGFDEMYPADVFPGPCPAVLGNHDYHDNKGGDQVQIAYSKTPGTRWVMPARWHRMDFPAKDPLVTFLFIDTNLASVENGLGIGGLKWPMMPADEVPKQWDWLKAQLEGKRGAWTICVGHHPIYSDGQHGDTPPLVKQLGPMFQEHNVAAYVCGHDHDIQHLELEGLKTSYILSGGGGAGVRELKKQRHGVFGKPVHGFTHLQASRERLVFRHLGVDGKQVHAFEKYPDGKFEVKAG